MAVSIRPADAGDAPPILEIYAPCCRSTCITFEIVPPTVEAMRERIRRISSQYPWLVAEIDGIVAGYVYASQHHERAAYRWSVDVAVYVGESFQRIGIARALYTALFETLSVQGYYKAHAGIALPNDKSVALHESMGFRPVGIIPEVGFKLGRWLDVGWWQRPLRSEPKTPEEPVPFAQLSGNPAIEAAISAATLLIKVPNIASPNRQ